MIVKKYLLCLLGAIFLSMPVHSAKKPGGIYIRGESINSKNGGLIASNGPLCIDVRREAKLDHTRIFGDRVEIKVGEKLLNRASKIGAKTVIHIAAKEQTNETVINKWSRDWRKGSNYVHTEGVESIDDCSFSAPIVIQEGEKIRNLGILVNAKIFEDQGIDTLNMPASVVLHNYAHFEKSGLFSEASSDTVRLDDFHVPTRYHVKYFKSLEQEGRETQIKLGYTLIDAGADIIITKGIKKDIPVDERHILEIHEEKSGISFFGGIDVPNSLAQLESMRKASQNKNMVGFTTAAIGAIAEGIKLCEAAKTAGKAMKGISNSKTAPIADVGNLVGAMSHFISGPSMQIGTLSVDMKQEEHITRGNSITAGRNMVFRNKKESSFCGEYKAKNDIDIKTKTFITYDMPHTSDSKKSVKQTGISMDLLSFAGALMSGGAAGMGNAMLASGSLNVSSQNMSSHAVQHIPTKIEAKRKLNIEAQNGRITQAQIKAALVHAIFTDDLVVETLADSFESKSRGYGLSLGLGAFAAGGNSDGNKGDGFSGDNNVSGFMNFVGDLKDFVANVGVSSINSSEFERKIDNYAAFVGTDEFYLKVGEVLKEKSAFLGHIDHDPKHAHIEAKERQSTKIKEYKKSYDHSFAFSVGDLATIANALESPEKQEQEEQRKKLAEVVFESEKEQGKSDAEAIVISKETEAIVEIAEKADRKVAQQRKSAVEAIRKAASEQAPEIVAQTLHMDDDFFMAFIENYAESHHDSITKEFLTQNLIFEQEMRQIYRQAEQEFEALSLSEKAKHYVMAARDAAKEYISEFAEDPLGHTKDLAGNLGYFAVDMVTPGGIDPAAQYLKGEISGTKALGAWGVALSTEAAGGFALKKVCKGSKVVAKALSCGGDKLVKRTVEKIAKRKVIGRAGKQARLKEIMLDDKISSAWRGWLKQDANAMRLGKEKRPGLRVPPGTQLAHKRGLEAAKGYGYQNADLQLIDLHKTQHRYDKMGTLNKNRGKK